MTRKQPEHIHCTEITGVMGVSHIEKRLPCILCDWGHENEPPPPVVPRKILQIAAVAIPETDGSEYCEVVYALCSDGTVWMKEFPGDQIWTKLADIPQD